MQTVLHEGNMVDFEKAESPVPLSEWQRERHELVSLIESTMQAEEPEIWLAECAYHFGRFEEAVAICNTAVRKGDRVEKIVGASIRLAASIALGNATYSDVAEAKDLCRLGLSDIGDRKVYETSVFCAHFIEELLCLPFEGVPKIDDCFDSVPRGMRAYCGYLMAYEAQRSGSAQQVIGIVRSFLALTGDKYPIPCIKFHLLAASAYLRLMEADKAIAEFDAAWELASPLGILAPFVEMNPIIPGLIRNRLHGTDEQSYLIMRALVRTQRAGWHDIRSILQHPVAGENVTPAEYHVGALAAWGWPNKAIASFLDMSENTVKHCLSNVYLKLNVKNRAELTAFMSCAP